MEQDLGLEKIDFEFRQYCWNRAIGAGDNPLQVFLDNVSKSKFGGVSSIAEAERLYIAEQIRLLKFLDPQTLPSQLAEALSSEIMESFQNISRPISLAQDPDSQMMEVLKYYFVDDNGLQNFNQALNGELDGIDLTKDVEIPVVEPSRLEGDVVPKLPVSEPLRNPFKEPEKKVFDERPKVKEYVNNKHNKLLVPNLSGKIKEIIDEYYS
jgi:hypothetical protein